MIMTKKIIIATIVSFLLFFLFANISPACQTINTVYAVVIVPNMAAIKAEVLDIELTNDVSKLELRITKSENVEDYLNWAIPGETIEAIAYYKSNDIQSLLEVKKGDIITAIISYRGDEWGGEWHATEVKVIKKGELTTLPNLWLLPDFPFYFLKTWKEQIQLFFTFGAENKARQYLHLAEVRLAEYQKMIEKGKTEIAQRTLEKYQKQLNRALEKADQAQAQGKDIKDLAQRIEQATTKHLEVLQGNLEKAPEQAKKGLENAIENSGKVLEKVRGKIEKPKAEDETLNWKTYRNEKYGFEVKYPNAYSQKVDNDETGLLIVRFENVQGISYYVIHVTEEIKSPKLSNFLSNPECYDQIETKKQNNIEWSMNRWKCGTGAEQNPIAAHATKQNYVFEIQLDSNSETSSLERINQILSTFKFIE